MKTIGIAAEYNPFHAGHEYHIRKTRELAGEDCRIVCVMSGDFVQRGEAAQYAKYARAETACRCGADLVVELPLPWALSSAEGFARGAVCLLRDLGATHISFGSECGDVSRLDRLAELLTEEETVRRIYAQSDADRTLPFAAARDRALRELGADAELLDKPNNILAVEYLKAIRLHAKGVTPMTVTRFGAAHDGRTDGAIRSASELRELLERGESIESFVPPEAAAVYAREEARGRRTDKTRLDALVMSRLRMLRAEDFEQLADAGGGLASRLYAGAAEETGFEAACAAAKTKRYAMSRIRRLYLCAALGVKDGAAEASPGYARVLAFNETGRELLHELRGGELPIVTKPAQGRALTGAAGDCFALTAAAHELFSLAYLSENERRGSEDWRTSPVFVQKALYDTAISCYNINISTE